MLPLARMSGTVARPRSGERSGSETSTSWLRRPDGLGTSKIRNSIAQLGSNWREAPRSCAPNRLELGLRSQPAAHHRAAVDARRTQAPLPDPPSDASRGYTDAAGEASLMIAMVRTPSSSLPTGARTALPAKIERVFDT
jgi:hypothetical protein